MGTQWLARAGWAKEPVSLLSDSDSMINEKVMLELQAGFLLTKPQLSLDWVM